MSLNVYTNINDVPKDMKIVRCNDAFFNCGELKKDEFTDNVLNEIDKANYNSNTTFIGRDKKLGAISMERLSTGCKTLLNIHYHPEICFDVIECGANALEMLAEIKNGNILWKLPILYPYKKRKCDIEIDGKRFTTFADFLHYTMDEV